MFARVRFAPLLLPKGIQTFLLLGVFALFSSGVRADVLTVSNALDDVANPPPGSLRKAIADATSGDTIQFAPDLAGTIMLAGAELLIDKDLTIDGPGASILALSGNQQSRVIRIATGTQVVIDGLTIRSGKFSETGIFFQQFAWRTQGSTSQVEINLQPDSGGSILRGSILCSVDSVTFQVEAKREMTGTTSDPVSEANAYTSLLGTQLAGNPSGFLRPQVKPSGRITLSGMLPDGTRLTSSSHLTEDHSFPIFMPIYAKKLGHLAGPAQFVTANPLPLTGELHWKNPANSLPPYADGLNDELLAVSGPLTRRPGADGSWATSIPQMASAPCNGVTEAPPQKGSVSRGRKGTSLLLHLQIRPKPGSPCIRAPGSGPAVSTMHLVSSESSTAFACSILKLEQTSPRAFTSTEILPAGSSFSRRIEG